MKSIISKALDVYQFCSDIDECTDDIHNCSSVANCTNLVPTMIDLTHYSCACPPGFSGDGFNCTGSVLQFHYIESSLRNIDMDFKLITGLFWEGHTN